MLRSEGVESHVVDAASIAISRRRWRATTDRVDGEALVRALLAYKRGEPRVCAMVRTPTPEEEDRRRPCRERKTLTNERVQHVNRIKGLLFCQGISDYEPREALFLQQLAHQFHRCSFIAPWLHEQVENLAFVVNRAPEPELLARNRYGHLIEMPTRCWPWASTAKFSGEQRPKLQNPSPHRFVGDIQTALRKQIFDVAIAERETHI